MEFSAAVRRRRMIRSYDPGRPVPRDVIADLLEHATHAPSAGFTQGWHFLVLDEPESLELFWSSTTTDGEPDAWLSRMRSAPCLIVFFSDKSAYLERYAAPDKGWTDRDEARWPVPYWHIDTGMAAVIALLRATDRGLGACFFGIAAERQDSFRSTFRVPDPLTPIGVISVGYPATDLRSPSLRRGRRAAADVISYNRFAQP
jgi:nitroreductase